MSKPQSKGQVAELQGKLEIAYVAIKRLEAEQQKLQRRLHVKAKEVTDARQSRKEALTLLREAANDPVVRDRAIALLAADAMTEQQIAEMSAAAAAQTSIPGTEAAQAGA